MPRGSRPIVVWQSLASGLLFAELAPRWVVTWDSLAPTVRVQHVDGRFVVLAFRGSPYHLLAQWAVALERGDDEALAQLAPGPAWLWPCVYPSHLRCVTDHSGESVGQRYRRRHGATCAGGTLGPWATSTAADRTW